MSVMAAPAEEAMGVVAIPAEEGTSAAGAQEHGTVCLDGFPVENTFWHEGRVECFQTMGRLMLLYRLADEECHLTSEDIFVEASSWRLEVSRVGDEGSDKRVKIEDLCGDLSGGVRRRFLSWKLAQEDSGEKVLIFSFSKLEYRPWKTLWCNYDVTNKLQFQSPKGRFFWVNKPRSDDRQVTTAPHDAPPPLEPLGYQLDPAQLCMCIDDVEPLDEGVAFYIHFNVQQYLALEAVVPLEQIVRADVKDKHVSIYLQAEGDVSIFEAEFGVRCVPEWTTWTIVQDRKGMPGTNYNSALKVIVFPDTSDEGYAGSAGPFFAWRRHAGGTLASKGQKGQQEPCGPAALLDTAEGVGEDGTRPYLVDNSALQSATSGLVYRLSARLTDKDGDANAEWGTVVEGTDQGDGWLKVGPRYLPFALGGKPVLVQGGA